MFTKPEIPEPEGGGPEEKPAVGRRNHGSILLHTHYMYRVLSPQPLFSRVVLYHFSVNYFFDVVCKKDAYLFDCYYSTLHVLGRTPCIITGISHCVFIIYVYMYMLAGLHMCMYV